MLLPLVFATGAILLLSWACAWRGSFNAYACAAAVSLLGIFAGCAGTWIPLFLSSMALGLVALLCLFLRPRPRWFMVGSLAAVFAGYLATAGLVSGSFRMHENAARLYPFESLSSRLAYERQATRRSDRLRRANDAQLARLDSSFAEFYLARAGD